MKNKSSIRIAAITAGHIPSRWAHSINFVRQAYAFQRAGYNATLYSVLREEESKVKGSVDIQELYGVGHLDIEYFTEPGWQFYIERTWIQKVFYGIQKLTKYRFHPRSKGSIGLAKKAIAAKVDIAHCRSFDVVPTLVRGGIPTILETHGLNIHHRRPIFQEVIAESHRDGLKGLVVPTKPVGDAWEKLGFPKEKIFLLPNGVDLTRYSPENLAGKRNGIRQELGIAEDAFVAAYTGHLYTGRGIEEIIEAARLCPDVQFLIVGGRQEDVDRYKAMAADVPHMIFTGFVPNGEVPFYTEASDVLLMPYTRDTSTWREMSPVKMYEYLAAGRPIITTDLPNLKEMLKEGEEALFVPEKEGKPLAEAILQLQADPALFKKISDNNAERAKHHSLVARAEALVSIGLR